MIYFLEEPITTHPPSLITPSHQETPSSLHPLLPSQPSSSGVQRSLCGHHQEVPWQRHGQCPKKLHLLFRFVRKWYHRRLYIYINKYIYNIDGHLFDCFQLSSRHDTQNHVPCALLPRSYTTLRCWQWSLAFSTPAGQKEPSWRNSLLVNRPSSKTLQLSSSPFGCTSHCSPSIAGSAQSVVEHHSTPGIAISSAELPSSQDEKVWWCLESKEDQIAGFHCNSLVLLHLLWHVQIIDEDYIFLASRWALGVKADVRIWYEDWMYVHVKPQCQNYIISSINYMTLWPSSNWWPFEPKAIHTTTSLLELRIQQILGHRRYFHSQRLFSLFFSATLRCQLLVASLLFAKTYGLKWNYWTLLAYHTISIH